MLYCLVSVKRTSTSRIFVGIVAAEEGFPVFVVESRTQSSDGKTSGKRRYQPSLAKPGNPRGPLQTVCKKIDDLAYPCCCGQRNFAPPFPPAKTQTSQKRFRVGELTQTVCARFVCKFENFLIHDQCNIVFLVKTQIIADLVFIGIDFIIKTLFRLSLNKTGFLGI